MNKTVVAFFKKILASMLIVNTCVIFFLNSITIAAPSEGMTVEQARDTLASKAEMFCRNKGGLCTYDWSTELMVKTRDNPARDNANSFTFECTGFVSCMIYWYLGLPYRKGLLH